MCQLDAGAEQISNTNHLVARFREIRAELAALEGDGDMASLARRWLPENLTDIDTLRTPRYRARAVSARVESLGIPDSEEI